MDEDDFIEQMRNTSPSWQEDGYGIKGIPVQLHTGHAQLDWEPADVYRRPVLEIEEAPTADTTG